MRTCIVVNDKALYLTIGIAASTSLAAFTFIGIVGSMDNNQFSVFGNFGGEQETVDVRLPEDRIFSPADRIGEIERIGDQYNSMALECDRTYEEGSLAHEECHIEAETWKAGRMELLVTKYENVTGLPS